MANLSQTLHDWQPFYCMTGEVAGTLIGLMFIAMSLGSRILAADGSAEKQQTMANKVRAFVSPTIIHLTSVVVLAAVMAMPLHRLLHLGITLSLIGLGGVGYLLKTYKVLKYHHKQNALEKENWMFHFYLPMLCYLCAIGTGVGLYLGVDLLPLLGIATVLFLVVGVRNSWISTLHTSGLRY